MLSFAVNAWLGNEHFLLILKLTNVFIHIVVGWLLYFFSKEIIRCSLSPIDSRVAEWLAFAVAALWVLHPLNVSTTLYAVQRMAQLSALFVLAGLYTFVRYRARWARRGGDPGEIVAVALWLVLFCYLATYSKENGILLGWLLLAIEYCIFKGEWANRTLVWLQRVVGHMVLLPFVVMLACYLWPPEFVTWIYQHREFTLEERVLTQLRITWGYVGWLLYPDVSSMSLHHDDVSLSRDLLSPITTLYSLTAWVLVMLVAFVLRNRFPLLLFGMLFFLIGHSIESGLLGLEMVYEHRNYLPGMGVLMIVVGVYYRLCRWRPDLLPLGLGVLLVVSSLLAVRVWEWSDNLRLSSRMVNNHPLSPRANYFHGFNLQRLASNAQLTESARIEAMYAARYFYHVAYELDSDDLAALVSLYVIDERVPGKREEAEGWLNQIQQVVTKKKMQQSDKYAVQVLVDCALGGACTPHRDRVLQILLELRQRYPTELYYLNLQYKAVRLSTAEADSEALAEFVLESNRIGGTNPAIYAAEIDRCSKVADVECMYSNVISWFAGDHRRRDVGAINRLFYH